MQWLRRLFAGDEGSVADSALRGPATGPRGHRTTYAPQLAGALAATPFGTRDDYPPAVERTPLPSRWRASSVPPPVQQVEEPFDELEQVFSALAHGKMPGAGGECMPLDHAGQQASGSLFLQVATQHARPLHEFMSDLALGPTTKQWLDIAAPLVTNLVKGAHMLELEALLIPLTSLASAIQRASESRARQISEAERALLLSSYRRLITVLPVPEDLAHSRALREPLLVHHLLRQVPGVRGHTIDRLYAAGLGSLDALRQVSREDLITMGHLDETRAAGIVHRFRSYSAQRSARAAHRAEAERIAQEQLSEKVERLAAVQREFERSEERLDEQSRRLARRERDVVVLDIVVLLVQLGEIELVEKIQRLPTTQRVVRLREYAAGVTAEA